MAMPPKEFDNEEYRTSERLSRFLSNVQITTDKSECWLWTGFKYEGYGRFRGPKGPTIAHRWFYQMIHGEVDDDLVIRHKCDNPSCVNPLHLEKGTVAQNNEDRIERGRTVIVRGENHPRAKVNDEIVRQVRSLSSRGVTYKVIGEQFSLTVQHVQRIVSRKSWGHVI